MRIVVTGSATRAASFHIRGRQLGHAIGAGVLFDAPPDILAAADIIIAVKRVRPELAAALRACGRPVVWDALDFFEQTTHVSRGVLVAEAKRRAAAMNAKAIIGATRRMADDLGSQYHLVHHGWDRGRVPIRQSIGVVAYEGNPAYLGEANEWIARVCRERGARFAINPLNYLNADVVIAMRAAPYDSYATRNWKSGIKLSNAQIAGMPFIGRNEAGYLEQMSGAELWAEDAAAFATALDVLADPIERERRSEIMFQAAPRLPAIAENYRRMLELIARAA